MIEKYGDNPADNTIEIDHSEFSGDTPITGQGIENLSVDIVIPLSDKYSYGEGYDNRASSGTTISSMAFVPGAQFNVFEDIFISFENDIDTDGNDQLTIEYVGKKAVDSASAGSGTISYNYVGKYEDLHNGGTLDLYFADGFVDVDSSGGYNSGDTILYNSDLPTITVGGNQVASPHVVGLSSSNTSSDNVVLPGGNMPGPDQIAANLGDGDDSTLMLQVQLWI